MGCGVAVSFVVDLGDGLDLLRLVFVYAFGGGWFCLLGCLLGLLV